MHVPLDARDGRGGWDLEKAEKWLSVRFFFFFFSMEGWEVGSGVGRLGTFGVLGLLLGCLGLVVGIGHFWMGC